MSRFYFLFLTGLGAVLTRLSIYSFWLSIEFLVSSRMGQVRSW